MIPGVDYAFARPNPVALKAAGNQFAVRYLSGGVSTKDLTAPEIKSLRAAGLSICLVWETSGGAAAGGRAVGVQHAQRAKAQRDSLGLAGVPVYFACDFDAQGADLAKVIAYIQGAASVLGYDQTGVYGGLKVIDAAVAARACRWLWQTYAWSYKKWNPVAQLRQVKNGVTIGGGALDLCEAWSPDYGQWPRPVAVKPPQPKPPVPQRPPVIPPAKPTPPKFTRVLKLGMSGDDVKALQLGLIAGGNKQIVADGHYGPVTFACVKLTQRRHPLWFEWGGNCGPKTYKAVARPL